MNSAAEPATIPERGVILAIADAALAERITRAIPLLEGDRHAAVASSLLHLRLLASRHAPEAILIDGYLVAGEPLPDALRPFIAIAPAILFRSRQGCWRGECGGRASPNRCSGRRGAR